MVGEKRKGKSWVQYERGGKLYMYVVRDDLLYAAFIFFLLFPSFKDKNECLEIIFFFFG